MVVVGVLPDSGWDAVDVFMMLLLAAASFAVGFVDDEPGERRRTDEQGNHRVDS